ncbi:MAG TPA: hypothetical protein VEB86_04240, partial [Chryseosolibacter sp.]|nr:hypothetical protein [Chryseosolibacter sp.]
MKKQILVLGIGLIAIGLLLITSSISSAQGNNEITVPLSDPSKRAKLKAHLNYGSITIKGTARKDILVKYIAADEKQKSGPEKGRDGLTRIGGGGMDLQV